MLIGSDMPIFGDKDHPSVSLKLVNLKKPINILTGLDYWLDNLMCQVPEVLMCFHDEGIVKNYEIFKTEDLPNLGPQARFNVDSVMQVAMNILAFLKRNATKEGHTYWLFKRKNDNMVKLYDLTSLCEEKLNEEDPSPPASENDSKNSQSPFQDAVSMLLYKVARNIMRGRRNNENKLPLDKDHLDIINIGDEDAIARRALTNCLKLLNKEKYPQIAASASYLLSDIYIPDDTNPLQPNFAQDKPEPEKTKEKSKKGKRSKSKKAKAASKKAKSEVPETKKPHVHKVTVEELRGEEGEDSEENEIEVEPLPTDVSTRANLALQTIGEGLKSVKYLQMKKEEIDEQRKKAQEQHERDNPKMCRPNEPIPMPYKISTSDQELELFEAQKKVCDWHDDLKALLLRKAFLVYVILAEWHFAQDNYGHCVKLIKRALNCYFGFASIHQEQGKDWNVKMLLSFAYGVAGDAFMILSERWNEACVNFQEGFNSEGSEDDSCIASTVQDFVEEFCRDWIIKVPKDVEEGLLLALKCFKAAKEMYDSIESKFMDESMNNLIARYGNALNVTATLYIRKATSLLESQDKDEVQVLRESLQHAVDFLQTGIECFANIGNKMNVVILATNAGMAYRTWAYSSKINSDQREMEHHLNSIKFYKQALEFGVQCNEETTLGGAHNAAKAVIYVLNEILTIKLDFTKGLFKALDLVQVCVEALENLRLDSEARKDAVDKCLNCTNEILALVFFNLKQIRDKISDNEKISHLLFYLRKMALRSGKLFFQLKNVNGVFVAWSLNLAFEGFGDRIQFENSSPMINLLKTLAQHGLQFKKILNPDLFPVVIPFVKCQNEPQLVK